MAQREKVEQAATVELFQALRGKVYVLGHPRRRGDYQGTMQTLGTPDFFVFLPAPSLRDPSWFFIFVESKADGGRLSPPQEQFRDYCQLAKVEHITGGFDAAVTWLVAHGYPVFAETRRRLHRGVRR